MPPFRIPEDLNVFPNPRYAEDDIVAIGGDLNALQLITAYNFGMFPWYNEEDPVFMVEPRPKVCIVS